RHHTLYLTVMSPDQRFSSTSSLTIQGNCRLEVQLDPGQAAFGVVPAGTPVAREVRVHRTGAPTWEVSGPAANESAPFDVRVVPEVRQGGRVSYRVQLALKPDTPAGTYRGDLNLLTNDPNNRTVPIPYDVTVQAPLTIAPDPSRFGTVAVGQAATRRVSVRAGRPFHILAVEGQADG